MVEQRRSRRRSPRRPSAPRRRGCRPAGGTGCAACAGPRRPGGSRASHASRRATSSSRLSPPTLPRRARSLGSGHAPPPTRCSRGSSTTRRCSRPATPRWPVALRRARARTARRPGRRRRPVPVPGVAGRRAAGRAAGRPGSCGCRSGRRRHRCRASTTRVRARRGRPADRRWSASRPRMPGSVTTRPACGRAPRPARRSDGLPRGPARRGFDAALDLVGGSGWHAAKYRTGGVTRRGVPDRARAGRLPGGVRGARRPVQADGRAAPRGPVPRPPRASSSTAC